MRRGRDRDETVTAIGQRGGSKAATDAGAAFGGHRGPGSGPAVIPMPEFPTLTFAAAIVETWELCALKTAAAALWRNDSHDRNEIVDLSFQPLVSSHYVNWKLKNLRPRIDSRQGARAWANPKFSSNVSISSSSAAGR